MEAENISPEDQGPVHRKTKWSLLRNVVRAVTLFKSGKEEDEVEEVKDVNDLVSKLRQIPTDNMYRLKRRRTHENSAYTVALKDLRREQKLQECVERGNPDDLQAIKIEIAEDPYKLLRNTSHPLSLINKRNKDGQTSLYIACKHGNLEVVQLLLQENADYLLTSLIDNEEESNLEVAVRWGHKRIAQELLKRKWPNNILNKAKSLCRSSDLVELFSSISTKRKKFLCCFCSD